MLLRVLVVSGSPENDRRLRRLVQRDNVLVDVSEELWSGLAHDAYDVLVVSMSALPQPHQEIVATLRKLPDRPEIIVVQDGEDALSRARLLTAGCLGVLNLGLADSVLKSAFSALIDRRSETVAARFESNLGTGYRLDDFSAMSPAMRDLLDLARRVARGDSSLLILGETGVGKEWLARAVHGEGSRAGGPFIAINCAAVPESLMESELFGHEKGAFTGSVRTRRGHFELAHGGTLFLDEVADLPVHLQAKLLRVLEERRIQRLGAERTIAVDVRIMAATNRDIEEALADGRFREDLYFRLGVVSLLVPPLRQRREDIAPLVHSYLERFSHQLGRSGLALSEEALAAMEGYAWPGNVRELINVVERAVLLARGSAITLADLPAQLHSLVIDRTPLPDDSNHSDVVRFSPTLLDTPFKTSRRSVLVEFERAYLTRLLERTAGRVGSAAAEAGLDPRSLYAKMRQLGLRKEDYRGRDAAGDPRKAPRRG